MSFDSSTDSQRRDSCLFNQSGMTAEGSNPTVFRCSGQIGPRQTTLSRNWQANETESQSNSTVHATDYFGQNMVAFRREQLSATSACDVN